MVEGSTWGRAGRRFRRIILVFFWAGSTSVEAFWVVRAWEESGEGEGGILEEGVEASRVEFSTSVIIVPKEGAYVRWQTSIFPV